MVLATHTAGAVSCTDPGGERNIVRTYNLTPDQELLFACRYLARPPTLWCTLHSLRTGRAGRRAACAYVLLRNSFSGKWGSFAQQRLLALSSVRRLQQPPCNVTVRRQDALAYLRALPCLAHQCIYADPPYIFPGRSMNYCGTRGGHDLVFHTELRDALFASGLPFIVSVNDVPEARELYSGADSITSLRSGKNRSKPELLVMHRGIPVVSTGLGEAMLLPQQD